MVVSLVLVQKEAWERGGRERKKERKRQRGK
jgi:hypothetical protein